MVKRKILTSVLVGEMFGTINYAGNVIISINIYAPLGWKGESDIFIQAY